jgi:colanic acid/amylovoran biosynthesis glycosyltransferase
MTLSPPPLHVGYVVKRYPRFSETFIVNEILAHEAAGTRVSIFSLRPPVDPRFQGDLARVRAPVTYLSGARSVRARDFWRNQQRLFRACPGSMEQLQAFSGEEVTVVGQAMELALRVRALGIDHLHAHFATSPASVTRVAAHLAGIGYTFTAHAKDIFHESVDPDDLETKLRGARGVVTVSDFNVADLARRFPAARERVRRIYNGLDLATFPFNQGPRHSRQVVAVGRLVEKKGFEVLVDACARLEARGTRFSCTIIGGGELEGALKARIEAGGLEDRVHLAGPLPRSEVMKFLARGQVLAAPCVEGSDGNRDGLPTVLLEGMALGIPCVSTPVTGIPELVRDGDTGLLAETGDAESLAAALERLLEHPDEGAALARRARRTIEADYDIHRNTAELRELFQEASEEAAGVTHAA